MEHVSFDDLCKGVSRPGAVTLSTGGYLALPSAPDPFVAPTLRVDSSADAKNPLAAEVLIVSSPAAVGKSTVAKSLSASTGVPTLNLADVPVSTRALVGLLTQDVVTPSDGLNAFHQGELAIIVDALDEGRLRSGEANFEKFLETTWELLRLDRSVTHRPKLILFGRDVATADVDVSLELYGDGIRVTKLTLEFFDSDQALRVIEAHAARTARVDGRDWTPSPATREVLTAFFNAIESALQLDPGTLWEHAHGRAFAGYAPVLAAIGSQLAREPNPVRLRNALEVSGAARAWDVLERVAEAILEREREEKMWPQLEREIKAGVPAEAYDAHEQLTYLVQYARHKPLQFTQRVALAGTDAETYHEMVAQLLPEHPFLQEGTFANDVLAAVVYAHAVGNDLLPHAELHVVREASRQPFLWRSVRRFADREELVLLRGDYVGCVLNSLWNDSTAGAVEVRGVATVGDDDLTTVSVQEEAGAPWAVTALHPIEFYEQLRNCDFALKAPVVWQGHQGRQDVPTFDLRGDVTCVVANALDVRAAHVRVDGDARLYADRLSQAPDVQVRLTQGSRVWTGGQFRSTYPWSEHESDLEAPIRLEGTSELERFLEMCAARLPRGAPLTVHMNYYPTEDRRLDWIEREFSGQQFSQFMRLMVDSGLARAESAQASGPVPKIRVHFNVAWEDLLVAYRGADARDQAITDLLDRSRALFQNDR